MGGHLDENGVFGGWNRIKMKTLLKVDKVQTLCISRFHLNTENASNRRGFMRFRLNDPPQTTINHYVYSEPRFNVKGALGQIAFSSKDHIKNEN